MRVAALLAHIRYRIIRDTWVLWSNLIGRHDHDGPTLDYCSCGCPIWGCKPCGQRNPWHPGDKVHSLGTGLAMTVLGRRGDRIIVWHHADAHAITRDANTVTRCREPHLHEPLPEGVTVLP